MDKTVTIPFSRPTLGAKEKTAINRVITSEWLAAGDETAKFEAEFAAYVGVKYAIFTNSGTSALKMAYKYYFDKGTTHYMNLNPNTFCATYAAAEEIGLQRYNKDIPTTPVSVIVHYGGIKWEPHYPIEIEDSAHRIEPNDALVGKIRCYSFYVTKNMTTGSGGMLVTNDKEIYDRCRLYWRDGLSSSTKDRLGGIVDYEIETMAGGYDGNDLAAALGRVQLKKLPEFTKRRNDIRDRYNSAFGQAWMGNHLYPYFVDQQELVTPVRQQLFDLGIGTGYHYPGAKWRGVSLPIYPTLGDNEVDYIIRTMRKVMRGLQDVQPALQRRTRSSR